MKDIKVEVTTGRIIMLVCTKINIEDSHPMPYNSTCRGRFFDIRVRGKWITYPKVCRG